MIQRIVRNLLLIASFSLFCACVYDDKTVYAYVVVKSADEDLQISDWRPVMRVKYHLHADYIISEVAGLLDEYHDCEIENSDNWKCHYEDGMGDNTFGFVKGQYYSSPGWGSEIRHISRWEYNLIRCKWYRHDSGNIKGMYSCLRTYI